MESIQEVRPDIALNWDYNGNYPETPSLVDINSEKQYKFICGRCKRRWKSSPLYMKPLKACPYCYLMKVKDKNDLQSKHLKIASEWNYERNSPIKPTDINYKSNRVYWWNCPNGHVYTQTVNRRMQGSKCPACTKYQMLSGINDFETIRPDLMQEWNWEKNDSLGIKPNNLSVHSHTKVWWKCAKGHEWYTAIEKRTCKNATSCPYCKSTSTSYPEQYLYWAFKQIYANTRNRFKTTNSIEYDIYIPEIGLCIEYSGLNWHKNRENDAYKENLAISNGKQFIQIYADERAKETISISNNKIVINPTHNRDATLNKIIGLILAKHNHSIEEVDTNEIKRKAFEYSSGQILYEESLEYNNTILAKEFDSDKNGIKPSEIKLHSNKRVWWKCNKCGHSWEAVVNNRVTNKTGCPNCFNINRLSMRISIK